MFLLTSKLYICISSGTSTTVGSRLLCVLDLRRSGQSWNTPLLSLLVLIGIITRVMPLLPPVDEMGTALTCVHRCQSCDRGGVYSTPVPSCY
ncbi:hypothetical protein BDQ17DRAFT_1354717, partial [Cyathus striatus]